MESLGEYLRSNRELKGLSLEKVASVLKIKVWYLSAIEQDFFDLLPSGGYDRKVLAEYAKYLGLDSEELIRRYNESCISAATSEPSPKTQSPVRKIARWLALMPVVLIPFLFVAWMYLME